MSRYKAHPEYKDSGVEWLGEVPEHWQVIPLKYLTILNPKKSLIHKQNMFQECSFIPMDKLKLNSIKLDEIKQISDVYDGYTYFENNDVLMAKVTPCFENKNMAIASNLTNGIGFGSSEIYVLRVNTKLYNQFLLYRLQEYNFMNIASAAMSGAGGLKRVPTDLMQAFLAAYPSYKEQQKIANFLDYETAKIDQLVAKQEKLIELLKEKRQAVISHAVTKGLNPDVPMKDSGVEWLGEIPQDWSINKLRFLSVFKKGLSITKDDLRDQGVSCVSYGDIHSKYGFEVSPDKHELKCVDNDYLITSPQALVFKGDFIFADTSEDLDGAGNFTRSISDAPFFAGYHTIIMKACLDVNGQ